MRGSRKFCRRGSNNDNVFFLHFLVGEARREDSNDTKSGSSQVVHICIMYSTRIQAESLIPSHARIQKVLSEGVKVRGGFNM